MVRKHEHTASTTARIWTYLGDAFVEHAPGPKRRLGRGVQKGHPAGQGAHEQVAAVPRPVDRVVHRVEVARVHLVTKTKERGWVWVWVV